ncbi:hypothetical protein RP726_05820 [Candidatus Methylospira mobilis]|uniref:secretion/conjugation apparatus DotM-related subunit n=1 Tax=Candidatus Methylospira mobilis TaxID=1808979 RepID=UPI0028ED10AA|nr:hypothetical protein [Candidatus Methylospira mobilis]WNV05930.1 hypothetical protein RP726_05820 [Candidatus Methylospira mobilis]
MSPSPSSSDQPNYDLLIYLLLFAGVTIGMGLMYESWRTPINMVLMAFNHGVFRVFAWLGDTEAARLNRTLLWNYPQLYHWNDMVALFSESGKCLRWVLVPCGIGLALHAYNRLGVMRFSSIYSMQRLIEANIPNFPCMAPVHNRKLTMKPESMDQGRWKTARTPLQFAVEQNLLIQYNAAGEKESIPSNHFIDPRTGIALEFSKTTEVLLDREHLHKLFDEQVTYSGRFESIARLNEVNRDHYYLLAAAFTAAACGDRHASQKLLDTISLGFFRKGRNLRPMFWWMASSDRTVTTEWWERVPVLDWVVSSKDRRDENAWWRAHHISRNTTAFLQADAIFSKYAGRSEVQDALRHQFNITWLMSLLLAARKKGVLACSQFIWLRPYDRRLWYALNQLGGKRAWVEATGAWLQFHYEQQVTALSDTTTAQKDFLCDMDSAVQDFINDMQDIGITVVNLAYQVVEETNDGGKNIGLNAILNTDGDEIGRYSTLKEANEAFNALTGL